MEALERSLDKERCIWTREGRTPGLPVKGEKDRGAATKQTMGAGASTLQEDSAFAEQGI